MAQLAVSHPPINLRWSDQKRSYLLSFLDRTNIGNARLAGMEIDLGMSGTDYNMSLTIFFVSYAVFEPLTNTLLKRFTPRLFFTAIIVVWGLTMTLMGLVTNFKGLLVARWFLGVAEAGLFPGTSRNVALGTSRCN